MSDKNNQISKDDKKKMQFKQQIFHLLVEVTELYPVYSISQHLAGILRRKDPKAKEFYHWTDEQLLKRVESYKQELEDEALMMNDTGEESDY